LQELRVLCASPSSAVLAELERVLADRVAAVDCVSSVDDAVAGLRAQHYDVVLTDLWAASMDGVRVVTEAGVRRPPTACILLRGDSTEPVDLSFLPTGSVAASLAAPFSEQEVDDVVAQSVRMVRRRSAGPEIAARCRVLSVFAERVDTRFAQTLLQMSSFDADVVHAGTLCKALGLASEDEFDLAFVDLMLPDARGVEAVRRLKTLRPELAVIVISDAAEACAASMFELGVVEVIAKHMLTKEGLEDAVQRAVRRRGAEARAVALAFRDGLTGLHNARYFHRRLNEVVAMARRERRECALFLLDLDGFKSINDSRGHALGDVALTAIARRLADCVRGYDVLARLGGDEFAFLIHGLSDRQALQAVAERVREAVRAPIPHAEGALSVGVSIGIAIAPFHGREAATLLHAADLAMYAAKADGGGYCFVPDDTAPRRSSRVPSVGGEHELLISPTTRAVERVRLRLRGFPAVLASVRSGGIGVLGLDGRERALSIELPSERGLADGEAMVGLIGELRAHLPTAEIRLEAPLGGPASDVALFARLSEMAEHLAVSVVLTGLGGVPFLPRLVAQGPCSALALDPSLFSAEHGTPRALPAALVAFTRTLGMRVCTVVPDLASAERAKQLGVDEVLVATATRPIALFPDEPVVLSA